VKSTLVLMTVAVMLALPGAVWAGDSESPAPPESTFSLNLEDLFFRLTTGAEGVPRAFTEPSDPPGTGTMYTIDEIMGVAPVADNSNGARADEVLADRTFWGLRTDGTWGLQTGTLDVCPEDPDKVLPGACGCDTPDSDSDGDGTPDCDDGCPDDPDKTEPGVNGCGTPEPDSSCLLPCMDTTVTPPVPLPELCQGPGATCQTCANILGVQWHCGTPNCGRACFSDAECVGDDGEEICTQCVFGKCVPPSPP